MRWSGFGRLLLRKTQEKHPGYLPPTVPDLPPQPPWKPLKIASVVYIKPDAIPSPRTVSMQLSNTEQQ